MKQKKSAILQMVNGERGTCEHIPKNEEYNKLMLDYADKMEKFVKQLKKYPELLDLYNKAEKAADLERMVYFDLIYKEAFSFGLAMGQEIFDE